ncbi:MAG TPA: hypothetical protein VG122_08025 [Gemmata sp.]|jgi:hypothetical protein|nr:hypothetical protein [Gemmata sp.]
MDQIDKDAGFNLKEVSQIRFKEMNEPVTELSKTIPTYYQLGDE